MSHRRAHRMEDLDPLIAYFVAGRLPNSAENLAAWVYDPQAIEPGNAMPRVGLTREEALDVAAYLLTLR